MQNNNKNNLILPISNIKTIKEIGGWVRKKRKSLKITQEELAGMCSTGTRFISDLENGKPTLQIAKVFLVLQSLGIELYLRDK